MDYKKQGKTILKTTAIGIALGAVAVAIRKSYSKYRVKSAKAGAVLSCIILCTSCGSGNGNSSYNNAQEAVKEYRAFLTELRQEKDLSSSDIIKDIKGWRVMRDSVLLSIERDTVKAPHTDVRGDFTLTHDSIRQEFYRLVLEKPRTYKDVILLKEAASPFAQDEALLAAANQARPFFSSLSAESIRKGTKEKAVADYNTFLHSTLKDGIRTKDDALRFVRLEDIHFRTFLSHLHELSDNSLTDITQNTEQCCRLFFQCVNQNVLSEDEAMAYMTIRTNRRLILNAQICADDVRKGRIKDEMQSRAYVWMLLQPFTSIDLVGVAMLTDKDRESLFMLSDQLPNIISRLNGTLQIDNDHLQRMPGLFMKIVIATM